METIRADFVIFGSGFGGSIMAMILRRLGFAVAMIERGKHPRFAIGESSTPFANLLLETLGQRFNLPFLRDLSEWGRWQKTHPAIACGLKRGFTFYHHRAGESIDFADRSRQLLVAASPNDNVADTHWHRPQFDQFLAEKARELGVTFLEEAREIQFKHRNPWDLIVQSASKLLRITAEFAIDASGANGVLASELKLIDAGFPEMPDTTAIYAHFRNVRRLEELEPSLADPRLPYPPEAAAVHHVFADGWIWLLHFNNGITSAGAALKKNSPLWHELRDKSPAEIWRELRNRFPTIEAQFAKAEVSTPFYLSPRISFRRNTAAGANWALLPSAAGFVDPLLSTGFALNLLGIVRLAELFQANGAVLHVDDIARYNHHTLCELDGTADLISALYAAMDRSEDFSRLSLLYFAALSFTETAWRLGKSSLASSFLLANDPAFSHLRVRLCKKARSGEPLSAPDLNELAPWDIAGLCNSKRENWHPVEMQDLLENRVKLRASADEINALFTSDADVTAL
jgi:FADH2 O2-dependent halogenase